MLELQLDESEEMIPYIAESPDLISALLSFESGELALGETDERPEDMLVRKACELRKWRFEGNHPRFLVQNWIEVVVTGRQQGFCRILNSRTHEGLSPMTLSQLLASLDALCKWLGEYKTEPGFDTRILAAYDELAESMGAELPLHEIYRLLNSRQPNYRRECFGLDLGRSLAKLAAFKGRRVYLSYAGGPATGRYALSLSKSHGAKIADRIRIDPDPLANQLMSLDI